MEDWPVMPLHKAYFQVRPFNFFPYNPAVSLPVKASTTTATATADMSTAPDVYVQTTTSMNHWNYWIIVWSLIAAAAFVVALYRAMRAPCAKKYTPIASCEQQSMIMPK
jgi:hypothetical protein